MPCVTPIATGRELELGWVTELLKEVNGEEPCYTQVSYNYWGRGSDGLDRKTKELCTKCKSLGRKINTMSPQLRYWWKRHQMHDELQEFAKSLKLKGDYPRD